MVFRLVMTSVTLNDL